MCAESKQEDRVAGLVPFTTLEFPGHLSAVIFLQGCPWRCTYCHNPHLQEVLTGEKGRPWEEIESFLMTRRGKLEGVVFSGGEPLISSCLEKFIARVRSLGFLVALHTAGAFPKRLQTLLPFLDWIGFDLKAPFRDYASITQIPNSGSLAEESLAFLLQGKIPFEVRVTAHPHFLSSEQIMEIAQEIRQKGVTTFALQRARTPEREEMPGFYTPSFLATLQTMFPHFTTR
ncbi:MAG: anaerobic ribonucleoside-triphosphate reductase activating protein [Holosporales bacterium]|nr:anaerobic ribonucleoside-triphosphate reductase activating protein [Holosporales bacterium]